MLHLVTHLNIYWTLRIGMKMLECKTDLEVKSALSSPYLLNIKQTKARDYGHNKLLTHLLHPTSKNKATYVLEISQFPVCM
jgi:hypothetical protein